MKKLLSGNSSRRSWPWIALALAFVLAILFWRSFLPDYVHFSNDGPLGQQNVNWMHLPSAIFGMWDDLNDIGWSTGAFTPNASMLLKWMLGPVAYAKFYAPCALFIMGLGALAFFRTLKLSPLAASLGALAVMLNSTYFGDACWGVASHELAIGFDFFALALVLVNTDQTPWFLRAIRLMLAGLCVGVNVMEAADIGALLSILVALFVFYRCLVEAKNHLFTKAVRGAATVAVIAVFAGFIAAQSIITLVGSNISGVAGTAQDEATKTAHWDFATQWSLPKTETLGLFIPGLFGYKMDTPKDMMPLFAKYYEGGNYWGGVGRDPADDRYFDSGGTGNPPSDWLRFTAGTNYCGILVMLIAIWTIAQSLRKNNSIFSFEQRKFLWFWSVVLVGSLLLAWGRFAPIFYGALYHLPYFSTIRNPTKFLLFFSLASTVLFAYGLDALDRRYLTVAGQPASFFNWLAKTSVFDRRWLFACGGFFVVAIIGCVVFSMKQPAFVQFLQARGFPDESMAQSIAGFSLAQLEWFIVLAAIAMILLALTISGFFAGKKSRLGIVLLGLFLFFDLSRADLPYVIHWDYKQKYDIDPANSANSINPIINFLRDKPYENRVAILPFEPQTELPGYDRYFGGRTGIYGIEWSQHHFPYYNIQSLDIIQMPRMAVNSEAYQVALLPGGNPESVLRRWELTNTRYLLGAAGFVDALNQQLDPVRHRFQIAKRFDIVPKPGIADVTEPEQLTAALNDSGSLAVLDFTGALPRAKLYSNWQVAAADPAQLQAWVKTIQSHLPPEMKERGEALAGQTTNDLATLHLLADPNFDPAKTVLIAAPAKGMPASSTNGNSGTVDFQSYSTKHIVLAANAAAPSVLLLNDKYDDNWHVSVDGKPAELLRCNYIMRGVYLSAGAHTVVFDYQLPSKPLDVTLAAIAVGVFLCGLLFFLTWGRNVAGNE